MPDHESEFPADVLVYVGEKPNGGGHFVVRPGQNRNNRWYWGDPTTTLRSPTWARTLAKLPAEGFYTLPETLEMDGGARWLENAVVQLGYNGKGQGIIFVAERHESTEDNVLQFNTRGMLINDDLLKRLRWAPILPIKAN
jgi:hypothetical protein